MWIRIDTFMDLKCHDQSLFNYINGLKMIVSKRVSKGVNIGFATNAVYIYLIQ